MEGTVLRCVELAGGGFYTNPDPYVTVSSGEEEFETSPKMNTKQPEFNETLTFATAGDVLKVACYDYDGFGDDILIGTAEVSLEGVIHGARSALAADLKDGEKRTGRVELEVFFSFFTIMISLIGSTRQSFDSTGMPWLDYPISRPTLKVEMPAERADARALRGARPQGVGGRGGGAPLHTSSA